MRTPQMHSTERHFSAMIGPSMLSSAGGTGQRMRIGGSRGDLSVAHGPAREVEKLTLGLDGVGDNSLDLAPGPSPPHLAHSAQRRHAARAPRARPASALGAGAARLGVRRSTRGGGNTLLRLRRRGSGE